MCAAAPLIGVALYMGVVGYLVGDPLAYFDIQAGWTFGWAFPFVPLVKDFHRISLGLLDGVLPPRRSSGSSFLLRQYFGFNDLGLAEMRSGVPRVSDSINHIHPLAGASSLHRALRTHVISRVPLASADGNQSPARGVDRCRIDDNRASSAFHPARDLEMGFMTS